MTKLVFNLLLFVLTLTNGWSYTEIRDYKLHCLPMNKEKKSDNSYLSSTLVLSKETEYLSYITDRFKEEYTFETKYVRGIDDEHNCTKNNNEFNDLYRLKKTFRDFKLKIINHHGKCSELLNITFPFSYMYRGCLSWHENIHDEPIRDKYLWVQNNYTSKDFILKTIFNHKKRSVRNIPFEQLIWIIKGLKIGHNDFETLIEISSSHSINVSQNCTIAESIITCNLYDLMNGTYFANLKVKDWICQYVSVSEPDMCNIKNKFDVITFDKTTDEILIKADDDYIFYCAIPIILLIILLIVFICFLKNKKNTEHIEIDGDEVLLRNFMENPNIEIFLVYARDCQPFMDAMRELRMLLAKLTGCKVYDIFDDSIYDELCTFSINFIYTKLMNENVKILLIATECAQVLYSRFNTVHNDCLNETCHNNCCNAYRNFDPLDQFVISTLKNVKINIDPQPFRKFFIGRLPALTDSKNFLEDIYPHRRFNIPEQLSTLIQCMLNCTDTKQIDTNGVELNAALTSLKDYIRINPNYLFTYIIKASFSNSNNNSQI